MVSCKNSGGVLTHPTGGNQENMYATSAECFQVTNPYVTDGQTDRQTDGRRRRVIRPIGCPHTRGRVRAGPSLQRGTLSTRIALYTRRWRASPDVLTHADYTLGAVAPLLACLRTPAVDTFSDLAALCRMPKTKLIGRPVPEIWPNLARTDSQTDTRQTDTTYQPAVLPVPSCWEIMMKHCWGSILVNDCAFYFVLLYL